MLHIKVLFISENEIISKRPPQRPVYVSLMYCLIFLSHWT